MKKVLVTEDGRGISRRVEWIEVVDFHVEG